MHFSVRYKSFWNGKNRIGETADVTFVPSYLDFGTFVRSYTCKEPLLSTNDKGGFLLHFGRKSGKIKQNKVKPGPGAASQLSRSPIFIFQKAKMLVYFLRFFTLQTNRKRDDAAGFEPIQP